MSLTSYRAAPSRVIEKVISNPILSRAQGNYSEAGNPFCANFVPVIFVRQPTEAVSPACLDREPLSPEVGDARNPTDKIRSVVRQESSRIRRAIA
jgi:hypothetical protein